MRNTIISCLLLAAACAADEPDEPEVATSSAALTTQTPGWLDGRFAITDGGAATYGVPIEVPRARGGLEPALSLAYSSQGGNGLVGVGWSLTGLSTITRCPRSYARDGEIHGVDFSAADRFCLDGDRLVGKTGASGGEGSTYATELDVQADITSMDVDAAGPKRFVVRSRDGRSSTYGYAPGIDGVVEGRERRGDGTPGALRRQAWLLTRVEDRTGNYLTITYGHDVPAAGESGLAYWPLRIDYSGGVGVAPNRAVTFEYEPRPDPITGYLRGLPIQQRQRLTAVRTLAPSVAGQAPALVRSYLVSYDASPVSGRSRVRAITTCDAGNACLAPVQFDYGEDPVAFSPPAGPGAVASQTARAASDLYGSGVPVLVYASGTSYYADDVRIGPTSLGKPILYDTDGDGYVDVLFENVKLVDSCTSGCAYGTRRFRGSHGGLLPYDVLPAAVSTNAGAFWDLDGDLVADPPGTVAALLATPAYQALGRTNVQTASLLTARDLFGDGRLELVVPASRDGGATLSYDLVGKRGRTGAVEVTATNLAYDGCAMFADVDGDGLDDDVNLRGGITVRPNLGNGTFGAPYDARVAGDSFTGVACDSTPLARDASVKAVDFDQDGRQDVLLLLPTTQFPTARVLVSDGARFRTVVVPDVIVPASKAKTTPLLVDFSGHGLFDVAYLDATNHLQAYVHTHQRADRMMAVRGPTTRQITYGFSYPSTAICTYPQRCVRSQLDVASSTTIDDGAGHTRLEARSYFDGVADALGDGFIGFARVSIAEDGAATDVAYSQAYDADPAAVTRRYPYRGLPTSITMTRADHTTVTVTSNTWARRSAGAAWFPYLAASTVTASEAGQLLSSITTTTEVDAFANPTTTIVDRGGGFVTTTQRSFRNDTARWLIGVPGDTTTTSASPSGSERRTIRNLSDATTGLTVQSILEPDRPALTRWSSLTRDAGGHVIGETETIADGSSRTTTTAYDVDGVFPIAETDALGHTRRVTWSPALGVPTSATDENGVTTTATYDGFARLREVRSADGRAVTTDYATTAQYPLVTTTTSSAGERTITSIDRLGREALRQTRGRLGQELLVATSYDEYGRLASVTRPYVAGATPVAAVSYEYDDWCVDPSIHFMCWPTLGRVRFERHADGSFVEHAYHGLVTDSYDESRARTQVERDVAGHVIATRTFPDGAPVATTFTYGPFETVLRVTDAQGNAVATTYDPLGRAIAVADRDLAPAGNARTVAYDGFGQVASMTDGKGVTATMTYDALGRPLTRTAPDGVDRWTWDTATGAGIGRLASATRGGVSEVYGYDALGRVAGERWTVDGSSAEFAYAYDAQGRLARTTYPAVPGRARFFTDRVYDAGGALTAVRDDLGRDLWRVEAVDGESRIATERLGNGLATTRRWDPQTGRLAQVQAAIPSYPHDLSYTYAANGNLLARRDGWLGKTETFGYDGANRLRSSTIAGGPSAAFTYDDLGNLKTSTDYFPGCTFQYGGAGAGPHALVRLDCPDQPYPLTYDGNGNTLSSYHDLMTASWTSFDKPAELGNGYGRQRYTYDAGHHRVKMETVSTWAQGDPPYAGFSGIWGTVLTLGDYEQRSGGAMTTTDHVFVIRAGGQPIAQPTWRWNGSSGHDEWRYFHTDAQGSIARTTDGGGAPVELASFDAWGAQRSYAWDGGTFPPTADTRLGYTGHRGDAGLGLVNMDGRIYHPTLKRFLSADTVVQAPLYGPSWNRYAYVFDNPLRYTDPTGHVASGSTTDAGPSYSIALGAFLAGGVGLSTFASMQWQVGLSPRDGAIEVTPGGGGGTGDGRPADDGERLGVGGHGLGFGFDADGRGLGFGFGLGHGAGIGGGLPDLYGLAGAAAGDDEESIFDLPLTACEGNPIIGAVCGGSVTGKRPFKQYFDLAISFTGAFADTMWNFASVASAKEALHGALGTEEDAMGSLLGTITGYVAQLYGGSVINAWTRAMNEATLQAQSASRAAAVRNAWIRDEYRNVELPRQLQELERTYRMPDAWKIRMPSPFEAVPRYGPVPKVTFEP